MRVPFIDITRFEPEFETRWIEKVRELSSGARFIGGPEVSDLETRLSDTLGVSHTVGCANGTDALQLALRALGVGAGDVVVIPNATFWATFEAVVNVGATPATVDISLDDGGIDIAALEEAIGKDRPKAVMIVHLYGWGSKDLKAIRDLCSREGIPLLEDGAQCFGATFDGEPLLKGAMISTTSFYPAKVLGAAGDAGAVFTNDPILADKVRRLGNHGRTAHYGYGDVGWNSRLDELQAAFLNLSLEFLEDRIRSRRKIAARYYEALPNVGLTAMRPPESYVENGYCNVCLVPDPSVKAKLEGRLSERGIRFGNIYPGTMSSQPGAAPYLKAHYGGEKAANLCDQVINLPLFPYMTESEFDYVIDAVASLEQR